MLKTGFKQCPANPCVYIHRSRESVKIVAVYYVDDLIILAKSADEVNSLKKDLSNHFKMKDMNELHYCLGIYEH